MEIKLKDFKRLNFKVGKIKAVKKHPKTDDFIFLVDIGKTGADKQVVTNLKGYSMASLMGKKVIYLENTEIKVVKGVESLGLLMCASVGRKNVLLEAPARACIGAKVVGLNDKEN